MTCCKTTGLDDLFTDKVSARDARKFRRRGLAKRARKLLHAMETARSLEGRTALEVGIGVGGLTIGMLQRGVTRAIGVDAIAPQLAQARILATEAGVAERLELRQSDFVEIAPELSADIVVLDRVVCCYPDWQGLVDAAARSAGHTVAMTYPRSAWYTRIWVQLANLGMLLLRRAFRLHLHSPAAMHALLRQHGFTPCVVGHHMAWELLVAQRA